MLAPMQEAQDLKQLTVPKWPFFLGDAIMLGLGYYVYRQSKLPLGHWEISALGLCVALGALLGVLPYLLEYRAILKYGALIKLIETSSLCAATEKLANLETCVAQISSATGHLQTAQAHADKTAGVAKEITERMAAEAREFTTFLQKANDGEKITLRLEVDKLRRAEADWLGVLVHVLDHIFALTRAAERSGQENLIAQLNQFQNACRDAARRVGLLPMLAAPGEIFDTKRHQLSENGEAPAGAAISEVVVTGYTFQGKLIRPVLVRVQSGQTPAEAREEKPPHVTDSSVAELPLGSAESPAT